MLGAYQYTMHHRPGSQISNADTLSRLPLVEMELHVPIPGDIHHLFDQLSSSIITTSLIRNWTGNYPVWSRVCHFVQSGWDTHSPGPEFQLYFNQRMELTAIDGCLLVGTQVVIPPAGRDTVLEQLHNMHPRINRMKVLARSYVWWPAATHSQSAELSDMSGSYPNPEKAPSPWERLHLDHAGPFLYLVIVETHLS